MLEDKLGHQKKRIESYEIRVFFDAEYDPGIKPGGLSATEQMDHSG
jgi:hypothetical protein